MHWVWSLIILKICQGVGDGERKGHVSEDENEAPGAVDTTIY